MAPPIGQDAALLEAHHVGVTYRTAHEPIEALRDLTLSVRPGEFVSLLGPSGCGKSTFLRLAAGLLPVTSGRLMLGGSAVRGPRPDVGVVFQQPTLLPWKTVLDNVLVPCRALRLDPGASRQAAMRLLDLTGMEKFAFNYPYELSGGMQQRVGVARGLVHDPQLLLMDEPFGALDAMTRERMAIELQRIWMATGKSVVFITHSIPEAVLLSDRVVVLSARPGTVVEDLHVPLPRPRDVKTMSDETFSRLCTRLRELFGSVAID
jgi:NitT/TauT family transport system ATP-binding protein